MILRRLLLCFLVLFLCSCGVAKAPLQTVMDSKVKSIELAKIKASNILLIRQVNPVFAAMGSSGLVMDAMIVADHASDYEKRAGPVHQMCLNLFQQTLMRELSGKGYKVGSSGKRYWDYYRVGQVEKTRQLGAILTVELKHLGFWSKGLVDPYLPAILVQAELKDAVSRKILYVDRFAIGMDITSLKVMELGYGKIRQLPVLSEAASYADFKTLLSKPEQSRDALLEVVAEAASLVADGFRRQKSKTLFVYEPQLFDEMPALPRMADSLDGAVR